MEKNHCRWFEGLLRCVTHPRRDRLAHALLEGYGKSAITPETALLGQLLSGEGTIGGDSITIESDKVLDAQAVDIGIVGRVMLREVLAEIITVGSDGLAELTERNVLSQVELSSLAIVLQQLSDVVRNGDLRRTGL